MPEIKHTIPPRDSWITLAPGAAIHMDERLGKEWQKLRRNCREIRGNVLAGCFEIEYTLDQVISEVLIPTSANLSESRDLLDELFLKGTGATFRSKIEVLRKLRARVSSLQSLLQEDIIAKLNAVREVRNDFAHYPVTFEPTGQPPQQNLVPVLISRRGRFALDDAFLKETGTLFGSVMSQLEAAVKSLLPPDPPTQHSGA